MTSTTPDLAPVRLKKNEDRRIRAGHLWVFSNEVDVEATPLTGFEPGQPVSIQTNTGKELGTGYANPHSLICARLVSRDKSHPFTASLIVHRLKVALALRERLYAEPFYRLVYGEGDSLPGLVIDRYGDVCVVQITTAGMERMKDEILSALEKTVRPTAVLWRNDSAIRELEGLERYVETALGEVPETIVLEENGVSFTVPLASGQKTGWFYDQRDNRARIHRYAKGLRVLDLFSYVGSWGVQAAVAGADKVLCVDASATAQEGVLINAKTNGVENNVEAVRGDAFDVLKAMRAEGEHFDLVIADPPAFMKRRKDAKKGAEAYRRLNEMAMQVLARDGLLVSCSCSHHLSRSALGKHLLQASRHLDRNAQFLEQGYQGPDHPIHPAIPETEYLKVIFSRITAA